MAPEQGHVWVTILAGGVGSRFWPASTPARPKQLLALAGDRPLIAETLERAEGLVDPSRIRILAGEHLRAPIAAALPDLSEANFMLEPAAKGTAPVLAWAAWHIARQDPDAVIVSLHADHHIEPFEAFRRDVEAAVDAASSRRLLMTIGAKPDRPETGYGYLSLGDGLAARSREVEAFHEKPDRETAARYVSDGYLWNTGIFVWSARTFLEEVGACAPEIHRELARLDDGDDRGFFDAVPTVTVDVAVMERSERVGVVPASFRWDDVGAWPALERTRSPDEEGNVVVGDGHVVEGHDNIVYGDQGAVVLFGVDDLVVVRTGRRTLVMPKARAADMKQLLTRLPTTVVEGA